MNELKAYESAYILGLSDEIAEEGLFSKWKEKRAAKKADKAAKRAEVEKCFNESLSRVLPEVKKIINSEIAKGKKNPEYKHLKWNSNMYIVEDTEYDQHYMDIQLFEDSKHYNVASYGTKEYECISHIYKNIENEITKIKNRLELSVRMDIVENGIISFLITQ